MCFLAVVRSDETAAGGGSALWRTKTTLPLFMQPEKNDGGKGGKVRWGLLAAALLFLSTTVCTVVVRRRKRRVKDLTTQYPPTNPPGSALSLSLSLSLSPHTLTARTHAKATTSVSLPPPSLPPPPPLRQSQSSLDNQTKQSNLGKEEEEEEGEGEKEEGRRRGLTDTAKKRSLQTWTCTVRPSVQFPLPTLVKKMRQIVGGAKWELDPDLPRRNKAQLG